MHPLIRHLCVSILLANVLTPGGTAGTGATAWAIASLAIVPTWRFDRGDAPGRALLRSLRRGVSVIQEPNR